MKNILFFYLITLAISYNLCSGTSNQCLPCPNQCTSCSNQSLCTACDIQYYYSANTTSNCLSCPENCLSCSSSSSCATCMNPYVLINQTCSLCVIKYALSCTTTVSASQCQSGYYLSDSYCNNCLLNCITCSSAYDCSACASGYYLNTSIITCNPCPQGCATCNQFTPSQCLTCLNGYQLSSNSCNFVTCNIPNCLFCSSSSVCSQCQQLYYWDGSNCLQGASVACENGAAGPLPNECINRCSVFSYQTPANNSKFSCKLYSSIYSRPVEYRQFYYYAYNHLQQLNSLAGSNAALNLQINGEYSYPLTGIINLQSVPNYYRIQIALKYTASTATTLTLNATTPLTIIQTQSHTISAASNPNGLILNSSVIHSNNIIIGVSNTIGIVQLRLRLWRCSAGCTICLNQQLCQLCDAPNFMLSFNCVQNCTVYIHFLPNRTCLTACPSNFYQIVSSGLKYCQACTSPCNTCTNATFCLSCVSGYFYYSFTCKTTCPSGHFPNGTSNTCASCISPCRTCTSLSNCLSCNQGFWNGAACSNSCPNGQFGDTVNNVCVNCDPSCLTCMRTAVTCTSCINTLIFYNRQCLTSCPSRFYNQSNNCSACIPPCYTCSSASTCLSCSYNHLLNGTCVSTCPIGFYQDKATLSCATCLSSCYTCTSGTSCTSCSSGCLFSGNCLTSCPSTQYFQQITNSTFCRCIQCIYPCNTCTNQSTCLTCLQGFLFNGNCLIRCPNTYFANNLNNTCTLCSQTFSNCLNCRSNACTQCQTNFYLLNGACLSTCPQFYFAENQQCLFCVAPCQKCTSTDSCLTCISPYVLLGSSCLIQCPSSMISLPINGSQTCQACTSPCLSCSIVQTNCTYCLFGYYLINYGCVSNCSAVAPTFNYYSQLATLTCQTCVFPCSKCSSQTLCLSCRIGYLNAITGTCSRCQLGTFSTNGTCFSCPSQCFICFSSTFCTSCTSGFYLLNNRCISNSSVCAVNGYYVSGNVCYPCLQPCSTCWVSSNNCTTCLQGYIFFSPNRCLVDCPSGYFNVNQTCNLCAPECSTCISSASFCLTCKNGFFLYITNSSCLTSCPSSTYLSGTSCSACQYPCLTCTSQTSCLTCVSGVLIGSQCYSSCLNGYFANSSLMCEACSSPCKQCTVTSTNCTQCITNYWLLNGTCVLNCPSIYFSEIQSLQCLKCVGLCQQCQSYVNCTVCVSGYILFFSQSNQIGECITQCPAGYYLSNNSCIPCSSQCRTCTNGTSCLTCSGNLVQYSGLCLSSCPSKMYAFGGVCFACSFPCENCTDAYTCTSCPTDFLLVASSSCVPGPSCPSGYYLQTNNISCNSKCSPGYYNLLNATCNNVSCGNQAFMGADMKCYITCPTGYLANQTHHCVTCDNCNQGLYFKISTSIIRDALYLYVIFTQVPVYLMTPKISLSPQIPYQSVNFESTLVGGSVYYTGSQNITFLIPATQSIKASTLNLSFLLPLQTFQNPLQRSFSSMEFMGYDYYPTDLPNLSSLGGFALIAALLGLIKNPFMTDFAQVLFFLGLLDTHYPRHLASFLQSCGLAHFHGILSLDQEGCLGSGKFMYLTGTGFLSNTIMNWILIMSVFACSFVLYLCLLIVQKRLSYSRVHQQSHHEALSQQQKDANSSGCVGCLQKILSDFKLKWLNRVLYFNYSIISLFVLTQLSDFKINPTINLLSCALAIIILPFLVFYPFTLKNTKPKYTFLYLRKLLIGGAVVLSTQDSIYAVGIISVCNVCTALLLLTYKTQRYRIETRFLATGQLLQLFTLVCVSFFIMIGEGNQTMGKVTLSWIIIGSAVATLGIYILYTSFQIFIMIYNWIKKAEFRQNWALNRQQDEIQSHHSESATQTVKDPAEKEPLPNQNMETLLPQAHQQKKQDPIAINTIPTSINKIGKHTNKNKTNGDFWAYEQSEQSNEQNVEKQLQKPALPQMLVRCVNQFSDYNNNSEKFE